MMPSTRSRFASSLTVLAILALTNGCASRTVRVNIEGLLDEVGVAGPTRLGMSSFQTVVDIALGETKTLTGARAGTSVRIRSSDVSAGVATLDLEVARKDGGFETILASPRVKVQLGEEVVTEMRDAGAASGLRYFRFSLMPRLLVE